MTHTPAPWNLRARIDSEGNIVECFVEAKDVNGYAYGAEILGDDEYHEQSGGIARRISDCRLISAAPDLLKSAQNLLNAEWANFTDDETNMQPELIALRAAIARATAPTPYTEPYTVDEKMRDNLANHGSI